MRDVVVFLHDATAWVNAITIAEAAVILRLKQYQLFAPQTVPVSVVSRLDAGLVLFDLVFFGRRPGLRFGTV